MFQQTAKLRLNPQHPLCKSDVDLRFCTFWTGTQFIDDLANNACRGLIRSPQRQRILPVTTTESAGNLPKHIGTLAMRSDVTYASEYTAFVNPTDFSYPSQVMNLVDNFTVAYWVRPYDISSSIKLPIVCTNSTETAGWIALTSLGAGPWLSNCVGFNIYNATAGYPFASDVALDVGRWSLVVNIVSQSGTGAYGAGVSFNVNGTPRITTYLPSPGSYLSGSFFRIGCYTNSVPTTYTPNCDMGPVMIWGTPLSPGQISLLYRDTWGMVSPENTLAMKIQSPPSSSSIALPAYGNGFFGRWRSRRAVM